MVRCWWSWSIPLRCFHLDEHHPQTWHGTPRESCFLAFSMFFFQLVSELAGGLIRCALWWFFYEDGGLELSYSVAYLFVAESSWCPCFVGDGGSRSWGCNLPAPMTTPAFFKTVWLSNLLLIEPVEWSAGWLIHCIQLLLISTRRPCLFSTNSPGVVF